MTTKIAEKINILLEAGQGLLIRLYNSKIKCLPESKERPILLGDQLFSKVAASFLKRFPEVPVDLDKVPWPEFVDNITCQPLPA